MIEFGKTLKSAREAKGLTVAQVAEMTRMAPSRVQELENEDFSRIAAPIYGRGFVKLYCEAVGLEAQPMVDEFMAIFNGEYDIGIKEREVPQAEVKEEQAPEPIASVEEEEKVADHQPPLPEYDLFSNATEAAGEVKKPVSVGNNFTRYAKPIAQMKMPKVPSSVWRFGVLLLGLAAIITFMVLGIRALYRATSGNEAPAAPAAAKSAAAAVPKVVVKPAEVKKQAEVKKPAEVKKAATTKRTPQKIPSLYID